ncbi:MAG: hypothetical protein RR630_07720 [Coprobacillus sp.]
MELHPKIKEALIEMNFIERYQKLSDSFDNVRTSMDQRLIYIDGEVIMDILEEQGYPATFESKEKFFKIKEQKINEYTFGFHIALDGGMVELIWVVWENDELLLGSPWAVYSRRLIDINYRIKKPIFKDYDDFEDIMIIAFKMFEDFKTVIISK